MAQNELVHVGGVEVKRVCGAVSTKGFKVLPLAVYKPRKAKEVKVVKAVKAAKAVGRPRVYNGTHRRIVAAAIKRHGLTKGIAELASREKPLKVSMTLAISVAKEFGLTFERGRPKQKKAA